jgi:hypothetical protein
LIPSNALSGHWAGVSRLGGVVGLEVALKEAGDLPERRFEPAFGLPATLALSGYY